MGPGDEIAGRFVVEHVAMEGAYSTVVRAHDRASGETVAVKVLGGLAGSDLVRFSREARLLAEQHHPGIVRYIAHGVTAQGAPWLAMEWLAGETLAARLQRGALEFDDAFTVTAHVAAALAELHRLGVVHRDIKPQNLFLPDGDVARIKVLDLGIAHVPTMAARAATRVGTILGTPGYMAPEQVRGTAGIDARADIFALGCVFFECITGRPPIVGDSIEALLGRTLLEDCPRLRTVFPLAVPALDDLLARMMSREPADRPRDGAAVLAALEPFARPVPRGSSPGEVSRAAASALTAPRFDTGRTDPDGPEACDEETSPGSPALVAMEGEDVPTPPPTVPPPALSERERLLLSVVLVALDTALNDTTRARFDAISRELGGEFEALYGAMAMVLIRGSRVATDQAARAARIALALRASVPCAAIAIATGWSEAAGRNAIGEAIDSAAMLLRASLDARSHGSDNRCVVRLSDVSAGLLDARFELAYLGTGSDLELIGERVVIETARPLLGRSTPCVGRRRELATLMATLDECIEEPVARAVLITGPPGMGKSRVRHEFELAARERHARLDVWNARADVRTSGAPYALLAELIHSLASVAAGDALPVRRQKIRALVARAVPGGERQRVAEFLGEISGTSFGDAESVNLRLARLDTSLMAAHRRRACEDFFAAECRVRPVLLVIEDLQWGDILSVRILNAVLKALHDLPFMVLALGRPEVHDAFPGLWIDRGVHELRVGPLTRRAAETLVRHCAGERATAPLLDRIIERAGGNPFFLEEIIRTVAAGHGVTLPGTVLAMVHARLGALDPNARRVLRAAAVFGPRFWRGGVASLLGEAPDGRTSEWLHALADREFIHPVDEGRFSGDQEYVFESPQLRDAAYGMLTDADRALGHRLAAAWMERAGERDAVVLGEHYERAGLHVRALGAYLDAARDALDQHQLGSALARVERALACGATGPKRAQLLAIAAEAHQWRGENADAVRCSTEALRMLTSDDLAWYVALREAVVAYARLGDREALRALAAMLLAVPSEATALGAQISARAAASTAALDLGLDALATELLASVASVGAAIPHDARGALLRAQAALALAEGDPAKHLALLEDSSRFYEASGNLREMCALRVAVGFGRLVLAMPTRALGPLREARAAAARLGLTSVAATAALYLAAALCSERSNDEAYALATTALEALLAQGNRRLAAHARGVRACVLVALGDADEAVREARLAVEVLEPVAHEHAWALGNYAAACLASGHVVEALHSSERAIQLLDATRAVCVDEVNVRLTHVDALTRAERFEEARALLTATQSRIGARAARITQPAWHDAYVTHLRVQTMGVAARLSVSDGDVATVVS